MVNSESKEKRSRQRYWHFTGLEQRRLCSWYTARLVQQQGGDLSRVTRGLTSSPRRGVAGTKQNGICHTERKGS